MYVEITGAPGSGKTTWINLNFPGQFILLGGIPLSFRKGKRVLYSIVLSIYSLLTGSISFKQIWWLLKISVSCDETLFFRINAFRNSITKFGYHFFKQKCNPTLVDEGISHIPFILGLTREDVDSFIVLFYHHLKKNKIVFIEAPQNEILRKRIITRGHNRVRSVDAAECFVNKNIRIAEYYKKALINAGFNVTII